MVLTIGLLTSQCKGFFRVFFFTRQKPLEQSRLDLLIQYTLHLHQQKRVSSCSNGLFILFQKAAAAAAAAAATAATAATVATAATATATAMATAAAAQVSSTVRSANSPKCIIPLSMI